MSICKQKTPTKGIFEIDKILAQLFAKVGNVFSSVIQRSTLTMNSRPNSSKDLVSRSQKHCDASVRKAKLLAVRWLVRGAPNDPGDANFSLFNGFSSSQRNLDKSCSLSYEPINMPPAYVKFGVTLPGRVRIWRSYLAYIDYELIDTMSYYNKKIYW